MVAREEVAVTLRPDAVVKVNKELVPTALVPLPNKTSLEVRLLAPVPPRATESCPVKFGMKVRVLAVVVLMLMTMLVSLPVATAMAGPVRLEMEVNALVR